MEINEEMKTAVAIALACIVAVSFASTTAFGAQPTGQAADATGQNRLIDVTGTYTVVVDPDEANVYFGVEKDSNTAADAQKDVANRMAAIRSALALKGIASSDIETSSYSVNKKYDWVNGITVDRGYTALHVIKVKVRDTSKVGAVIDAAVGAGADKVNRIEFGLSDAKKAELKKQALTEAAKNARMQADAIASGLGVKITGVESASTTTYSYQPYPMYGGAVMAESVARDDAPTEIDPKSVSMSATVSVTFSFE